MFSEEQKGCRKRSGDTGEILYIHEHILYESKIRQKNFAMAWIDNKKAYVIAQSWIINYLKMYQISDEVINFIEKTMKNWRGELIAGGKGLAEAKIQRGIFIGDAQSPLLFVIAMMPLNHKLRQMHSRIQTQTNAQPDTDSDKCTAGYRLRQMHSRIQTQTNAQPDTDSDKCTAGYRLRQMHSRIQT